jgi:hypothetical protein
MNHMIQELFGQTLSKLKHRRGAALFARVVKSGCASRRELVMQKQPVSTTQLEATVPPAPALSTRIPIFIKAHAVHLDMITNYGDLLQDTIFTLPPVGCDPENPKLLKHYRRTLNSIDAYKVLAVIWKESPFVDDDVLAKAGLSREYKGRALTSYTLAADFSETPQQVGKLNSRIRDIGLSAAAYQLIDRQYVHNTKAILTGTTILHSFMLHLGEKNSLAMARFVPLSAVMSASPPANSDER